MRPLERRYIRATARAIRRLLCSPPLAARWARAQVEPGNARPSHHDAIRARRPARPRAAERPARPRDRARLEAAGAPVGPQPAPDVLVPRELSGGARPRVRRPLHT